MFLAETVSIFATSMQNVAAATKPEENYHGVEELTNRRST
jgi:hypothetical protein